MKREKSNPLKEACDKVNSANKELKDLTGRLTGFLENILGFNNYYIGLEGTNIIISGDSFQGNYGPEDSDRYNTQQLDALSKGLNQIGFVSHRSNKPVALGDRVYTKQIITVDLAKCDYPRCLDELQKVARNNRPESVISECFKTTSTERSAR